MHTEFFSYHRFLRPGITTKLFLSILLVCVFMAVSMGVATRVSFQSGFFEYLTEIEHDRITLLAFELGEEYKQAGDWHFLRDNKNWRKMINRFIRKEVPRQTEVKQDKKGRKKASPEIEPPLSPSERARLSWETLHLRSSLGLLSEDKLNLIAGIKPGPDALWIPIAVNEATVGWLTREPLSGITDSIDQRFDEQQGNAFLIISVVSLLVAALAAMLMARTLIAPLRRFAETTGRLAAGDFSARVKDPRAPALSADEAGIQPPPKGDELQILASQLNHLGGVLQRNEEARRTFMAEIAHDLRTPLAILRGEIEAMQDGLRSLDAESLASLKAEVEVLGRLVDDIHTLSLADLGMLHYDRKKLDLKLCLAGILAASKERISTRDITLEASLPDYQTPILADPARMGQVLRNILENSLRYTDTGGHIQVRCHTENEHVYIDVLDSPPAVPEEALPFLFERFHTGDSARNRSHSGSGLGLAICRTLLRDQGGDIRALPSPLGGLWIRISLPLLAPNAGTSMP